jgi:class 3 adenylate cyclase
LTDREEAMDKWGEGVWADFWLSEEGFELTDADRRAFGAAERATASPAMARAATNAVFELDVRGVLSSITVPTLILHRRNDPLHHIEHARYMAEHIPGAKLIELVGPDHSYLEGDRDALLDEVEVFLTGARHVYEPERVLATVLFADIVGSTERAAALGDGEWRILIERHDLLTRTIVDQHRGRLIRTTGDGMLATFDGPGRALRCASALREALRPLGLEIRAGLHTGEIELTGNDIAGIGVHIAARVLDKASAGQLLTSAAVPMLVAGSGIEFEDRGSHALKGVPGEWRLFACTS